MKTIPQAGHRYRQTYQLGGKESQLQRQFQSIVPQNLMDQYTCLDEEVDPTLEIEKWESTSCHNQADELRGPTMTKSSK